jgi:hypothetical protein
MKKIEELSAAESAETAADPSKFMKAQSLRLDKQIIRTLTGAELRIVGGGHGCNGGAMGTSWVNLAEVPWRPDL